MMSEFNTPFVKWVGGKRQLINKIEKYIPSKISTYYEPFLGGGALFLHMEPKKAVLNDYNEELINAYKVIQDDVEPLILALKEHEKLNSEEYFYEVRAVDRTEEYSSFTDVERAARLIYLNKTCYNGLYRVNSQGFFNTPYGKYKNPNIVNEYVLKSLNTYFNKKNITFKTGDFEDAVKGARKGAFVYFDPPYAPLTKTANFTGYTDAGFGEKEQIRLKNLCDRLDAKGVKFLVSNSNVELIQDLYSNYNIDVVNAKRAINSNGKKRGDVEEVLIYNYTVD